MRSAAVLALVLCGSPLAARADEPPSDALIHRVKKDDTLGILASEYYGDRNKAIFIMVKNQITHPRPLKVGERLKIPISRPITTKPGDTFDGLAAIYLRDPKRGGFLATFNNLSAEDSLPAGTQLLVPFTVQHTAQASETLSSIALAYFNDAKVGDMLRRYNFLDKATLDKGESITVPVFNVRLQAAKLPPLGDDEKSRQAMRREAMADAAKAIPSAWAAWRAGEVAAIEVLLKRIDPSYLDAAVAADVWLLRGLAHVAEDKLELALDDFRSVLAIDGGHVLRRFDHSPRILDAWKKAGGKIE